MNPHAMPVTPSTSKGCERDLLRFLLTYQAAVEDDAADNRFATRDRKIQPMGSEYAADICGRSRNYMLNTLNAFNDSNPAGLKEFVRLWFNGLDKTVIDALLRPRHMVAFALPDQDIEVAEQLSQHMASLGKEVGDVFAEMQKAFSADGEAGCRVSQREFERFRSECLEVIPQILQLIEDMREAVSCR